MSENQIKDPNRKTTFVLRTSNENRIAYGNFQWPERGYVEAKDWEPTQQCGNGLHGLRLGVGDYSYLSRESKATWQIVEVYDDVIVDLGDKIKYPFGWVVYSGDSGGAIRFLLNEIGKVANAVIAIAQTNGIAAHAQTSGYAAHAQTSGSHAHAQTSGENAHAQTSGSYAHAQTSGDAAHAQTSGSYAHAQTSGENAIAISLGAHAKAKADDDTGCIVLRWYDKSRVRVAVGYVGENIKAGVWYCLDVYGNFVECKGVER